MNIKYLTPLCTLILLISCDLKNAKIPDTKMDDFDKFCSEFGEIIRSANFPNLSPEERAESLNSILRGKISTSGSAYLAWSAIRYATPSQRASLYKEAAASAGNEQWECPIVEAFADKVGSL